MLVYVEEDEPRYKYQGSEYHEHGPYTVGPRKRAYSKSDSDSSSSSSSHHYLDRITSDISHHFHGYHDDSYYSSDSSDYFQPYSALDELEAIIYRATRPVFNKKSHSSHSDDHYYYSSDKHYPSDDSYYYDDDYYYSYDHYSGDDHSHHPLQGYHYGYNKNPYVHSGEKGYSHP